MRDSRPGRRRDVDEPAEVDPVDEFDDGVTVDDRRVMADRAADRWERGMWGQR